MLGEIADELARKPGRREVDKAETQRIGIELVQWFERGEFADDEVLAPFGDPPHFRPLKPLLEDARRQAERVGRRIELEWRELILTRPALRTYLERSTLDGAPRLLRERFSAADGRRGKRPTAAQLDEWMERNVKPGAKRDATIADCCKATGATFRAAAEARMRLPADQRLRPGQKKLRPEIDH
jgi:hypothetical protein